MLGILLNYIKNANNRVNELSYVPFFVKNIFGEGTSDYTIESGVTKNLQTISTENGYNLSFRNFTIENNASVIPVNYYSGNLKSFGAYSTIYLQCSDTLTVAGHINADGFGDTVTNGSTIQNIIKIPLDIATTTGISASLRSFERAKTYASNRSLISENTWVVGGGGSTNNLPTKTIATGWEGGAGGFVCLYYKHLYIDGKEYGIESCDLTKISANGVTSMVGALTNPFYAGNGGGCIVIAARTINITSTGKISANGTLSPNAGQTIQGRNYSLLNNIPQLGKNQIGTYWNNETKTYVYGGNTDRTYYYDDGTGNGVCNRSIASGNATGCGGAGIAIGIKL